MTVTGHAAARRVLGVLAVALAAGAIAPAAGASLGVPESGSPTPSSGAAAAMNKLNFGVRIADIPVIEARDPRAYLYIIDSLPTGSVIHRRIYILNKERTAANFSVYAGAAQIANGSFIGLGGAAVNELTQWITVQHPTIRIGPGKFAFDMVTIRVPKVATRGEHYAVIWAEQVSGAKNEHGVAVRVAARVGVRIYLAVGRGGVAPTKFEIMTMTAQRRTQNHPLLVVNVINVGGRAVDLTSKLQLTKGPGGATVGPFNGQQVLTLAPTQSGNVIFGLPATLPPGPWLATVTMTSGLDVATAQATVSFVTPTRSWINTATLAGAAALLILIAIASALGVRARRTRRALA